MVLALGRIGAVDDTLLKDAVASGQGQGPSIRGALTIRELESLYFHDRV
jgi:hypothetical protein